METSWFTKSWKDFFKTDQDYADFQEHLCAQPTQGEVVVNSGGLRKLRWADPGRGKGKRGGCRVLYLHLPDEGRLLLIDIYGKDEQDDFSPADLKEFKKLIQEYKETLAQKKAKKGGKKP